MKTVKQAAEHTVLERRDGRYAVRGKDKKWINGEAKVEILVKEGLLKKEKPKAKPKPEAEAEAASAEEAAAEAAATGDSSGETGEN